MKIAILHDHFRAVGGAERLVLTLAKQLSCDIITAEVDPLVPQELGFEGVNVIPLGERLVVSPFLSAIWKQRFSTCDVSSKYDFFIFSGNHSIYAAERHKPNLWYCHSPATWLYTGIMEDPRSSLYEGTGIDEFPNETWYQKLVKKKKQVVKRPLLPRSVSWWLDYVFILLPHAMRTARGHRTVEPLSMGSDTRAVGHINAIVANSRHIQEKIKLYYGRESRVVYPPVDCDKFETSDGENFWLSVNRVVPEKRIDLQIEAFGKMPRERLVIVGSWDIRYEKYAKKLFERLPKNITVRNELSNEALVDLYARCTGFITTAKDEDFGMTAIEAMAAGKPVIAPSEGGYRESIVNGKIGRLIDDIDAEKIADAVLKIGADPKRYRNACLMRARAFDASVFIEKMQKELGI